MAWNLQLIGANAGMTAIVVLASYFLGCFATGYYLVKWKTGRDIRKIGSGNTGARNAGRALGRSAFFLTLIGDFFKGLAAVWLAFALTNNSNCALLALISVVIGHMWPIQLGFRGGKGISTSVGGLSLFLSLLGCFFLLFGVAFLLLRKTTLSGMVAYALLPAACFFLWLDEPQILSISILAALVIFAHRRNIIEDLTTLWRPSSSPKTNVKKL